MYMIAGLITTTANKHGDMSVQQQPITWRQDLWPIVMYGNYTWESGQWSP